MARALVIYESMFGNTQHIAEAIADGVSQCMPVEVVAGGAAPTTIADDVTLVIAGAPTHAFGLSRETTRNDARQRAGHGVVSNMIGIREWLDGLAAASGTAAAATFDTRIDHPRVPGSAAKKAEKRLRRLGYRITAPAESFYVSDVAGPLLEGEINRARDWGGTVAAPLAAAVVAT